MLPKAALSFAFLIVPAALVAQGSSAAQTEARTRAPSCDVQSVDRIAVDGPGERAALESVGRSISYWLRAAGDPRDRSSQLAVRVSGERSVEIRGGASPADSAFESAIRQAVEGAIADHAFDALAPAPGAISEFTVLFGRTADGRAAKPVTRRVCYAVARPDNPRMAFPPELRPAFGSQEMAGAAHVKTMNEGSARARFRVDSAGAVVPGSIQLLGASDEAFARELQRSLPTLHFYPATIAGRPLAQVVEQEFTFRLAY